MTEEKKRRPGFRYSETNNRIRLDLGKELYGKKPSGKPRFIKGQVVRTEELASLVSKGKRTVTPRQLCQLMCEREDLENVGKGLWLFHRNHPPKKEVKNATV